MAELKLTKVVVQPLFADNLQFFVFFLVVSRKKRNFGGKS